MLKLSALTKRYDTGDLALNQVDLEIPDAQVLALIGPSGAGKSTLMKSISGADVLIKDQLFATLDTKIRKLKIFI